MYDLLYCDISSGLEPSMQNLYSHACIFSSTMEESGGPHLNQIINVNVSNNETNGLHLQPDEMHTCENSCPGMFTPESKHVLQHRGTFLLKKKTSPDPFKKGNIIK